MFSDTGWAQYNIWEHSSRIRDLYRQRCRLEAEEMTCAAQAAEILAPTVSAGDVLLDVGCGSGYFYHSLQSRGIPVEYWGIDASPALIQIGQEELPAHGLPPDRLRVMRIEDLAGRVDHVVCMNVLSNIDNFHRPLERLLHLANKTVVLRESVVETGSYLYVRDAYLDPGVELSVHVNSYSKLELSKFIECRGFEVERFRDQRTSGEIEMVIGYPHHWTFFFARRTHHRGDCQLA